MIELIDTATNNQQPTTNNQLLRTNYSEIKKIATRFEK